MNDLNETLVFIPVNDIERFEDYDDAIGWGGYKHLVVDGGIVCKKSDEEEMKQAVTTCEEDG